MDFIGLGVDFSVARDLMWASLFSMDLDMISLFFLILSGFQFCWLHLACISLFLLRFWCGFMWFSLDLVWISVLLVGFGVDYVVFCLDLMWISMFLGEFGVDVRVVRWI